MTKGLISIVVPVYNHAMRIAESLKTAFDQTYKNFEIIVVNDGSTDNFEMEMEKIRNEYSSKNYLIKVITQENRGAPAARNRGFKEASGEFVIFWDADLVAKPEMLQKMP